MVVTCCKDETSVSCTPRVLPTIEVSKEGYQCHLRIEGVYDARYNESVLHVEASSMQWEIEGFPVTYPVSLLDKSE